MVDKEPVLRTKNGRSFVFSPEWYPDLIKMCNASLHMLGFGADMVLALATDIYATRMLIDEKEAPMYTPSQDWAYWFMRSKMGLRLRKIAGAPVTPEVRNVSRVCLPARFCCMCTCCV
jgi:hypothetical protein